MQISQLLLAKQALLEPAALSESQLSQLLNQLLGKQVDMADLYFQLRQEESWFLEEGIIKSGAFGIEQGVGVRVVNGESTGFAYSEDLHYSALTSAAQAARSIAKQGALIAPQKNLRPFTSIEPLYLADNPLNTVSQQEKIVLLQQIEASARQFTEITQVQASLHAQYEIILIVRHDGLIAADVRPLVRLDVSVIAERNGRREQGFTGMGGRTDYRYFLLGKQIDKLVEEAVNQAVINLESVPAPAGTMPVVLGPGWPGVLLHEAVGHGLEGDFNRKGHSAFSGRMGDRVATPHCTIVDNGTLPGQRGSLTIDDEGTPTQCTVLIEKGILKGYMQDTLNARLMGTQSTGNGRRESYAHLPLPRMTNTYMLPGNYAPEEIIKSVDHGLYAVNFSGGQVDITSGKFVFSACEAYLIEKGKITRPVKGATLIGNGPDVLTRVSMVGNDLKLDSGVGTCGKQGQTVPVSVGQPTLKIDALTVGGTAQ
jgi:TldD protein